jgi:hypothetical protein
MRAFRAFVLRRFVLIACGLALSMFAMPRTAAAQALVDEECFDVESFCDVEGVSAILSSTDSSEIDTYVATQIEDYSLLDEYEAYVEGYLYEDDLPVDSTFEFDDGEGLAESYMFDPVSPDSEYELDGYHEIDDFEGDTFPLGYSQVTVYAGPPRIDSLNPSFGYVGTSGTITVRGKALIDPFSQTVQASFGGGTGLTLSAVGASPDGTELILEYTIAKNATVGPVNIVLGDRFGISTNAGQALFTVADPQPMIFSVLPSVWQAGTSNLPITITGSGFGTNPSVSLAGAGVSLVSVGSTSDTSISATVSIASNAPNETATVTVQSNGYGTGGTGFVGSSPSEPSTASYNVMVDSTPAPAPTIFLYSTTNITNQTTNVATGQQIALSAMVNLPQGQTITSQSWSTPPGTAVGNYTNQTGTGPPDNMNGGEPQPLPPNTGSSFTFYWVDSANSREMTYTYTMSNGESNSATTTFNVDGPAGVTVGPPSGGQMQSTVNIVPPPNSRSGIYPVLIEGAGGVPGINLLASASHLPTGGKYQWVQLINSDTTEIICPAGPQTKTLVPSSGSPKLDNTYPYSIVTTTNVTNDGANDSPSVPLPPPWGELARSFSANMYLMWVPPALSGCSNGTSCTIPVPLGSFQWSWSGDGINTLMPSNNSGVVFPIWNKNEAADSNNGFLSSSVYPSWSATFTNGPISCN